LGANLWLVHEWWAASLGELEPVRTMRGALWGLTGMVLGLQVAYGAFFLALLVQWPADSAGPQAGLIGP
jgi:hypothetical protein